MFVAIDRTSKFAFVELHEKATTAISREFLLRLIAAVPYKIHTVLTDNGIQFTTPGAGGSAVPLIKEAIANGERFWAHTFEYTGATNDIEHRTTKAKHPWTNGQVERMNRTIKDATVKRFYYEGHSIASAPRRLRRCLQFRPQAQDPQRLHALRVHLQDMGFTARTLYPRSAPPDAGTKHLMVKAGSLKKLKPCLWLSRVGSCRQQRAIWRLLKNRAFRNVGKACFCTNNSRPAERFGWVSWA